MPRAARAILFLCLSLTAFGAEKKEGWWTYALRLTGEKQEVRQSSIEALRRTPALEETLRSELRGDRRFLALDVITALKLRGMFGDLVTLSESDPSGLFYASLNTLIDESKMDQARELYRKRAFSKSTAPAAKMVLIDTLARMGVLLSRSEVVSLLEDPSFEVRSAALGYLRHRVLALGDPDTLSWGKTDFEVQPWQLRLQFAFLVSESPIQTQRALSSWARSCGADPNPEVSALCAKIAERTRS